MLRNNLASAGVLQYDKAPITAAPWADDDDDDDGGDGGDAFCNVGCQNLKACLGC